MIKGFWRNINAVRRDLKIIGLTPAEKRKVLKWTYGEIKKNARSNITKQQTPDLKKWRPRAKPPDLSGLSGKEKRDAKKQAKMLKRRAKLMGIDYLNDNAARLGYKVKRTAQLSQIHQEGLSDSLPADPNQKRLQKQWKQEQVEAVRQGKGATAQQAARLKALGYNAPKNPNKQKNRQHSGKATFAMIQRKWKERILGNKNRRNVSESEIMQTLTIGQAGVLIRLLDPNYDQKAYRQRWKQRQNSPMPERPFLDTDQKRNFDRMDQVVERVLKQKNS